MESKNNNYKQRSEAIKKAIGQNLKRVRDEKGLSQVELGALIGCAGNTVSSWESGTNAIDTSLLILICEALDISFDEIYKGITKTTPVTTVLSDKETELINLFKSLPEDEQLKQIGRMEAIVERDEP